MKRIPRAEEGHLRSTRCGCEMHRRRIEGDEEPRPGDQRREREQIDLAGKIDKGLAQFAFDFGEVCPFQRPGAAGQNRDDLAFQLGVLDNIRPTLCPPESFCARCTGMENDKWLVDPGAAEQGISGSVRVMRHL